MPDIYREEPTSLESIFCFFIYMSFFIVTYNSYYRLKVVNGYEKTQSIITVSTFAILIAATYFIDADYFHYHKFVYNLSRGYEITTQEPIYVKIAQTVFYNYFLFRIVVWGLAFFIFYKTCKLCHIRGDEGIYALMIMYGNIFCYARASLGMAVLFYGFTKFIECTSVKRKIVGLSIMILSIFFHTSMVIALLCCIIAMTVKWKRKTIVLILLAFPLIVLVLHMSIVKLLGNLGLDSMIMTKLQYYTDLENGAERSFIGRIQAFISILAFILPILLIAFRMYFNKRNALEMWRVCKLELYCFQCAFLILVISFAFYFIGLGTEVFAYRIRFMAMIPIVISLLGLYYKRYLGKRPVQICFLVGFTAIAMKLFSALKGAL